MILGDNTIIIHNSAGHCLLANVLLESIGNFASSKFSNFAATH